MDKIKKQDDSVIKALDIKVIRRLICQTDKGPLELIIRKGENNYFLSLDATPLDKEVNDKLMGILFKPEVPTVKFNRLEDLPINPPIPYEPKGINHATPGTNGNDMGIPNIPYAPKKKGRPAKVK